MRACKIRPRGGFTLAEILAACGLLAVIMAMSALVLLASVNGLARGAQRDMARQLGLAVYDFYRGRLISARELSIDAPMDGAALSVDGGKILYAPPGGDLTALYPDSMYAGGLGVRVTLGQADGVFELEVEVFGDEGGLFVKRSAFRALTLERLGRAADFENAENPAIFFN